MLKHQSGILLPLILLVSAPLGLAQTGTAGQTGLAFLKLGVGGRATGMGEAFVATADGAYATYWNPAGLSFVSESQAAFTHTQWIQGISNEFIAFAFPAFRGTIGLSVYSSNVGGIERRNRPSEQPLGSVEAHDLAFGLSYGRALTPSLRAGITVKYLYEKIFIESASGFAVDLGLSFKPLAQPLRLALVAQNFGAMASLGAASIDLPKTIRAGASYFFNLKSIGGILIEVDGVKVVKSELRANFGFELRFKERIALRLGYQTGFEEKSVGAGFGVQFKRYRLDYSYTPFGASLGDSHKFSFGLGL